MQIIDFHTHIYPDKIAERGTQSTCDFYGLTTDLVGNAKTLKDEGKKAGISKFVLLPVALKPEQVRHINTFTAEVIQANEEFYGFGGMHPDVENPEDEINAIEEMHLLGVKIHPDIQHFAIDDKRMYPIYEMLEGRMPLFVHCGDPRYDFSRPEKLRKILDDFPRLTAIAAHLGGWSLFENAYQCLKEKSCYLDVSSSIMFDSPTNIKKYITGYGPDRILFGTDFPLWNPKTEVERFLSLGLSDEYNEKILWKNASKLLGIE